MYNRQAELISESVIQSNGRSRMALPSSAGIHIFCSTDQHDGSTSTISTRNDELKKRRMQLQMIVHEVTQNIIQRKAATQPVEHIEDSSDSTNTCTKVAHSRITVGSQQMRRTHDSLEAIVQNATGNNAISRTGSRSKEMNKRDKYRQKENVQNVTENIVRSKGIAYATNQFGDSNHSTIMNDVSGTDANADKSSIATRTKEMKKRRESLQLIVQKVTECIEQPKVQIAEKSTQIDKLMETKSNTREEIMETKKNEMRESCAKCRVIENLDQDQDEIRNPMLNDESERTTNDGFRISSRFKNYECTYNVDAKEILREGFLSKQSKVLKVWRRRWFVLTSSWLYAFKSQSEMTTPTEVICLSQCSSVTTLPQSAGMHNVLCLDTPERTLLLSAPSHVERDAWTEAVYNACLPSMVVSGCLGHRLSKFAIPEEGDEEHGIGNASPKGIDCKIKGIETGISHRRRQWDSGLFALSDAALFKLLGNLRGR